MGRSDSDSEWTEETVLSYYNTPELFCFLYKFRLCADIFGEKSSFQGFSRCRTAKKNENRKFFPTMNIMHNILK